MECDEWRDRKKKKKNSRGQMRGEWLRENERTGPNVGSNPRGQPRGKQFVVLSFSLYPPPPSLPILFIFCPPFSAHCWLSIRSLPHSLSKATSNQDEMKRSEIKTSAGLFVSCCTFYLFLRLFQLRRWWPTQFPLGECTCLSGYIELASSSPHPRIQQHCLLCRYMIKFN